MPLQFGTSGVRGLVTEMTDREVYLYVAAFALYLREFIPSLNVLLAGDRRPSTMRLLRAVHWALRSEGLHPLYRGCLPTPALALAALNEESAGIMVTGSHVPADRNGLKFYLPMGEIMKQDEVEIAAICGKLRANGAAADDFTASGALRFPDSAGRLLGTRDGLYRRRYLDSFPPNCLRGLRLVFYEHSAVGRTLSVALLRALGADVVPVGRSARFVAVDTEAVEQPARLAAWVNEHRADALLSTDGDGDRPLLVDETGTLWRGDTLGLVTAAALGADFVAVPVSANTAVERCGRFARVVRTRIGSPYVIAAMYAGLAAGAQRVVGYEANGGFLTASELTVAAGRAPLAPLPTRDALLPLFTALLAARRAGVPVSALRRELPARYTASGLQRECPTEAGRRLVDAMRANPAAFAARHLAATFGPLAASDFTDGARFTFADGRIVHFRPSGNAPEFRCYAEAESEPAAAALVAKALELLTTELRPVAET